VDRFYQQSVTVPPGTVIGSATSTPFLSDDGTLKGVNVTIPYGHNGLTGIRILYNNQQIMPWSNYAWLVANGRTVEFPFDDYITAIGLVAIAYNLDVFAHTFYLECVISDRPSTSQIYSGSGSSTSVLPATQYVTPDPLSPAALIATVPPDAKSYLYADVQG